MAFLPPASIVSTVNSTSTPLGIGGVFTGVAENIVNISSIMVNVYSDVASATDGLSAQQSSNGTDWDNVDNYTIPSGGKNFTVNPHSKFFRIVYTNGAIAQSEFRLQIILKQNVATPSSVRLKDDITSDDDAQLNKIIISADSGDGQTFKNINAQHPLPTDGDSVYEKDIDQSNSTSDGFTGGEIIDLFNSRFTTLTNSSGTNPKVLNIALKRPIQTNILGLSTEVGTFSNTKITTTIGQGVDKVEIVLWDESSDNTAKTLLIPPIEPSTFSSLKIEFHTANACSLSTVAISKSQQVISRIQGVSPNGTVKDVNTNVLGNLLVSLSEQKDAFGRLKIAEPFTIFDNSLTNENADTLFWSDLINGTATAVYDRSTSKKTLTTVNTGDYVVRQTKQRMKYQPAKALRHGTQVLTDCGWVSVEEVNVGDIVFDGKGKKTKVKAIYPQGLRQIYRLKFDDGTNIDCDGDHLWKVLIRQGSKKGEEQILTTLEMLEKHGKAPTGFQRWRIPSSPILDIEEKNVLISPYTMGLILGDGYITNNGSVQFTTADEKIISEIPYEVVKHTRKYGYGINGIAKNIRYYGLIGKTSINKFIPKEYLFNCEKIRIEILRGLMDTDGTVDKRDGTCTFSSSSKQLADDVAFLVRSLGGQARIKSQNPFYYNEDGEKIMGATNYRVSVISPINPFLLERKAMYYKKRERISFDRYVHSIEPVDIDYATCIHVASDEHTFLIENNITTHNSHEFFITGLFFTETGQRKRAGLVDYDNVGLSTITNVPQNGIFFENNAGVLSWNIVNNGFVTETANQDNWNIDKLDGTGVSGFTLDINATNILTGQFEWLGVGVVLVGFATGGGEVIYVHAFQHASVSGFEDVYMRTANLPVAYEITSISGGGSLKSICNSVISGGGFNPVGVTTAVQNTTGVGISSGVTELLIGIRMKEDSFEYTIDPTFLSILSTSNGNTLWTLSINPTYSGSVTWVDVPNSEVQKAVNNSNVVSDNGIVIAQGSFSNNSDSLNEEIQTSLKIGKDLLGNRDELWLSVTALGNETYHGTINFKELL